MCKLFVYRIAWIILHLILLISAQEKVNKLNSSLTSQLLDFIDGISSVCSSTNSNPMANFEMDVSIFDELRQKADLLCSIIRDQKSFDNKVLYISMAKEMLTFENNVEEVRMVHLNDSAQKPNFSLRVRRKWPKFNVSTESISLKDVPWTDNSREAGGSNKFTKSGRVHRVNGSDNNRNHVRQLGFWTYPYRSCSTDKWLISYTVIFNWLGGAHNSRSRGIFSVDVDTSKFDINQCDANPNDAQRSSSRSFVINNFQGTHRCDNASSQCVFVPENGWVRGSYQCVCRKGYYSSIGLPVINGTVIEAAHRDELLINSVVKFDLLYAFKKCQPGCDHCIDDAPCLSSYNWMFRISLLTICIICILLTFLLIAYVYTYRKLKIIKVSSPIFLYITLIGAIIMYSEMAAIFPVLDMYSCIATKWTRNLGFCITYSALLLKTWRVSLTYRVKSAHKLKLTDKQLLQWLFPILLVMVIYLSTWTLSTPPHAIYLKDWYNLKFKQCEYGWWDHSLAIGEILFLLWGIRVCYNVRNAESFFNEAKYISWAIYNIALVNLVMVGLHLVFLPDATPDMKYLFGFVRTQLSTTITIILVFGPKFYRVIKGQGDTWDNRSRVTGVTASFSLNGVGGGLMHEDTTDLYQENEELKEEIQKLAAQMEFMKIVHMEMNNRHLKPKHGGVFSQQQTTNTQQNQSPVIRTANIYAKFDTSDSPTSRISPAAELISERV